MQVGRRLLGAHRWANGYMILGELGWTMELAAVWEWKILYCTEIQQGWQGNHEKATFEIRLRDVAKGDKIGVEAELTQILQELEIDEMKETKYLKKKHDQAWKRWKSLIRKKTQNYMWSKWNSLMIEESFRRKSFYHLLKTQHKAEEYLEWGNPDDRVLITNTRLGTANVGGSYTSTLKHKERNCQAACGIEETELHVILECTITSHIRSQWYHSVRRVVGRDRWATLTEDRTSLIQTLFWAHSSLSKKEKRSIWQHTVEFLQQLDKLWVALGRGGWAFSPLHSYHPRSQTQIISILSEVANQIVEDKPQEAEEA
jgi:hypothetical protein